MNATKLKTVHVIGAGPAGLMAAETLAAGGARVVVHEAMPSVGRKFLMAGRGGLNLTHSEPLERFLPRYGSAQSTIGSWFQALTPQGLRDWADALGGETFVGSSGRVFPRAMKASPLLRAWLRRLTEAGVDVRTRSRWIGTEGNRWTFQTPDGVVDEVPDAVVLALGGASWPRLGSDGYWVEPLEQRGVKVSPMRPANVGFDVDWSPVFATRFAGQPLKPVILGHGETSIRGEVMISRYGLEGGAIYALSAGLREAIQRDGQATIAIDLRPDLSAEALSTRLSRQRGKDSVTNWLRKAGGLSAPAIGLLREIPGEVPQGPEKLARRIKAVRLTLTGMQGLDRAISSTGGVRLDAVDERLMLKAWPGVFAAGEMLDWEAPTGGYLLQASFASGRVCGQGVLDWLAERDREDA